MCNLHRKQGHTDTIYYPSGTSEDYQYLHPTIINTILVLLTHHLKADEYGTGSEFLDFDYNQDSMDIFMILTHGRAPDVNI